MAIHNTVISDNGSMVANVRELGVKEGDTVLISVNLPDYLDTKALLAMEKRMSDLAALFKVNVRLLANTTNTTVEKYAMRLFDTRDNIFISVDWRNNE